MCWSPTADAVGGSIVAGLGVIAVLRVREVRELPLAALPLLLGAHQLIESVIWRNVLGHECAAFAPLARTIWAVIAFPLLPAYLPIAVWLADGPQRRRTVSLVFIAIGLATALALARDMASGQVTAYAVSHTMRYGIGIPLAPLVIAGYLLATVGAPLAAGDPDIRMLGLLVAVGAAVCAWLWLQAFASTWCAFAAVVSLQVVHRLSRPKPLVSRV